MVFLHHTKAFFPSTDCNSNTRISHTFTPNLFIIHMFQDTQICYPY